MEVSSIDYLNNYFKEKKVLFATNGDDYPNSPIRKSVETYYYITDKFILNINAKFGRCFGYDAFIRIFEYAIEKGYDYIIYIDADCFIVNPFNLKKRFDNFMERECIFSGVTDGGIICHRNKNPYSINPFLMFCSVSRLKKFHKNNSFEFIDLKLFSVDKVTDKTKLSLNKTIDSYKKYRENTKGFHIPHADLISQPHNKYEFYYGNSQHPWTNTLENLNFEPYYKIFLGIHDGTESIDYMDGIDYVCDADKSGMTSALFTDANYTVDNLICVHTWFTRAAYTNCIDEFVKYHRNRIFNVADMAIKMNKEIING